MGRKTSSSLKKTQKLDLLFSLLLDRIFEMLNKPQYIFWLKENA